MLLGLTISLLCATPETIAQEDAMLRDAAAAESAYDDERALSLYRRFERLYPTSPQAEVVSLKVATLLETLNRLPEAADALLEHARKYPDSSDSTKNLQHAGVLFEGQHQLRQEIAALTEFLRRDVGKLPSSQQLDARVRIADALEQQGKHAEAKRAYADAADEFDRAGLGADADPLGADAAAQARFQLAEYAFAELTAMTIRPDRKYLEADLSAMKQACKSVQSEYDKVVPYKRPEWTLAAFYRKGAALVVLLDVLRKTTIPPEPPHSGFPIGFVGPGDGNARDDLAVAAAKFFEDTLDEADRRHIDDEWIARCRNELRKLAWQRAAAHAQPLAAFVLPSGVSTDGGVDRHDVGALHALAEKFLTQTKPALAGRVLDEALTIDSQNATTHYLLGTTLLAEKKPAEAREAFKRAIELAPNFAPAENAFGALLLANGEAESALDVLSHAASSAPSLAAVHVNLGNAHRKLGSVADARREYLEALRLDPNSVEAHFNLGILLVDFEPSGLDSTARWRDAIDQLETFASLGGRNPVAEEYLAEAKRRRDLH